MKRMNLLKKFTLIALVALSFYSCNKDEDPSYAGTWVYTETEDGVSYRDKMVLTSGSFENIGAMKLGDLTDWIDLYGMKGKLSASGNIITITLTSVGTTDIDFETGEVSDMNWYNSGTDEFNDFLVEMETEATMKVEFTVSGNSLTIVPDIDGDGDYDSEESMIYTRQ